MTTPELPAGRTVPDTDDLRLLAELINNEYIPLANAAWNARMSQLEAATRLVQMAERGLPLRLLADGDRQALWQIAQAGPATGAVATPESPAEVGGAAPVGAPPMPSVPVPPVSAPVPPLSAPVPPVSAPVPPVSAPAPVAEPSAPPAPPAPLTPPAPSAPPADPVVPLAPMAPVQSAPYGSPVAPPYGAPAAGAAVPPPAPVPPHEQAIAGAVPLGQPPFGQPQAGQPQTEQPQAEQPQTGQPQTEQPSAEPADHHQWAPAADQPTPVPLTFAPPLSDPDATQIASVADVDQGSVDERPPAGPGAEADAAPTPPDAAAADTGTGTDTAAAAESAGETAAETAAASTPAVDEPDGAGRHASLDATNPNAGDAGDVDAATWGVPGTSSWARSDAEPGAGPEEAGGTPAPPPPRTWATQSVVGPAGEQLAVTVLDVLDPGDAVLTGAGYRMEPGQRAVLVFSSVANTGQGPYYPVGDLYLVLESAGRQLLGRAAIAVGSHPAYPVGVMPGQTTRGWSVFLIPADTPLAGIKWCIRPDLPQTILSWPIGGQ